MTAEWMAPQHDMESADLAYFLKTPWCARHLEEPNLHRWRPTGVRNPQSAGANELWSTTFNTPETVPAFIAFYRKAPDPLTRVDEIKALIAVNRGVQGYPGFAHGGFVVTMLDEITGMLGMLNRGRKDFPDAPFMTGYITTRFLKPVKISETHLLTARIVKVENRKFMMSGTIQDHAGETLAECDALFITLKPKL